MESIISQILGSVSTKFIQELVKKHIIDDDKVDEAKAVWKTCVTGVTVNVEFGNGESATFGGEKVSETVKEKKSESEKKEECGKCVYVSTRGKTPGTACGKKAMVGKKMCSSHKKHETDSDISDGEPRTEVVAEEPKKVVAEEPKKKATVEKRTCVWTVTKGKASGGKVCGATVKGETDFCTRHAKNANKVQEKEKVEEPVQEKEKPIIVSLDKKTGRWTHKDSGFVMKSKEELIVNGKIVNGVVADISEDDVELLKTLKFKYELPIKTVMRKSDVEEIVKEMLEDDILGEELEEEPEVDAGDEEYEPEEEELLEDDE